MMTEGDGLRPLQMGVAGHYGVAVFFSLVRDNLYKVNHEVLNVDNLFFEVELNVNGNLVVTAS